VLTLLVLNTPLIIGVFVGCGGDGDLSWRHQKSEHRLIACGQDFQGSQLAMETSLRGRKSFMRLSGR
jgi:hypothetical protein